MRSTARRDPNKGSPKEALPNWEASFSARTGVHLQTSNSFMV